MTTVYLVPSVLAENAIETIPAYILPAVKNSQVIFAENERTARRFLKTLDRTIVIDDFEWFPIHKAESEQIQNFQLKIKEGKNIAIISEAGCPGVADPGQILVAEAQRSGCIIKPLTGPSSILLALMASGMNGQQFAFCGYLPVDSLARNKKIAELEIDSKKNDSTKIFIETPYRNDQMFDALIKTCSPQTMICVAANLTAADENIKTKTVAEWKNNKPLLHKQPVIFLMYAGT